MSCSRFFYISHVHGDIVHVGCKCIARINGFSQKVVHQTYRSLSKNEYRRVVHTIIEVCPNEKNIYIEGLSTILSEFVEIKYIGGLSTILSESVQMKYIGGLSTILSEYVQMKISEGCPQYHRSLSK